MGSLSVSAKRLLLSTLVTNLGNGMHTLVVGKLLYDQTGSAAAFGSVIIVEFLISFVLQFYAGDLADKLQPRFVCFVADITRGLTIVLCALAFFNPAWTVVGVLISTLAINVGKAFYRAALFALIPQLVTDSELAEFNSYNNALYQTGQLLGLVLAAPLLQFLGPSVSFAINGLSFLAAGGLIGYVSPYYSSSNHSVSSASTGFFRDWLSFAKGLRHNALLLVIIFLACGDFLSVALMNLHLVPLVEQNYGGNVLLLSVFDGSLALGSMLLLFVVGKRFAKLDTIAFGGVGLLLQAICVYFISLNLPVSINALVMVLSGGGTALSLAMFATTLQRLSEPNERGKTTSVRIVLTSVLALLLIPIASHLMGRSIASSLLLFSGILFTFGALTLAVSTFRSKLFAQASLTNRKV